MSDSSVSSYLGVPKGPLLHKNGILNCKSCKQFIPAHSMDEHNALKHNLKQGDLADKENRPFDTHSYLSKSFRKPMGTPSVYSYSSVEQSVRYKDRSSQTGEVFNFEPKFSAVQPLQRIEEAATPSSSQRFSRQMTRNAHLNAAKKPPTNRLIASLANGNSKHKGRAASLKNGKPIPTIYEMFEITPPESLNNEVNGDGGKTKRRSLSAAKKPLVIPENHIQCKFCSNVMHRDYFGGKFDSLY